jgi:hypothetical protein
MAAPAVPTLSDRGWSRTTPEKIDFLVAHYLEAEKDYNIQTSIMNAGDDMGALLADLQKNLSNYLERYFEAVTLNVQQDPKTPDGAVNILLDCMVTDDSKNFSVGMTLQSTGSRFKILQNINNYGTA